MHVKKNGKGVREIGRILHVSPNCIRNPDRNSTTKKINWLKNLKLRGERKVAYEFKKIGGKIAKIHISAGFTDESRKMIFTLPFLKAKASLKVKTNRRKFDYLISSNCIWKKYKSHLHG